MKPPKGIVKYCGLSIKKTDGTTTTYRDFPARGVKFGADRITLTTAHWITVIPWSSISELTFNLGC